MKRQPFSLVAAVLAVTIFAYCKKDVFDVDGSGRREATSIPTLAGEGGRIQDSGRS